MLAVFGVIAAGIVISLWQGRLLMKQKRKKDMVVFSSTMLLAIIINICVALNLPLPSAAEVVGNMLEPIVKPIVHWIKGGSA
jgi:hypothetical protein